MEDVAEQQEVSGEIANVISNPIGLQTGVDDEELLKELEEMEEVMAPNYDFIYGHNKFKI